MIYDIIIINILIIFTIIRLNLTTHSKAAAAVSVQQKPLPLVVLPPLTPSLLLLSTSTQLIQPIVSSIVLVIIIVLVVVFLSRRHSLPHSLPPASLLVATAH